MDRRNIREIGPDQRDAVASRRRAAGDRQSGHRRGEDGSGVNQRICGVRTGGSGRSDNPDIDLACGGLTRRDRTDGRWGGDRDIQRGGISDEHAGHIGKIAPRNSDRCPPG